MSNKNILLQVAVDRMSISEGAVLISKIDAFTDIIEIGTSYFKDYGWLALSEFKKISKSKILADIKTVDEATYEFEKAYRNGADIATVLGTSSVETLIICQEIARKYRKKFMIDTIGMSDTHYKTLELLTDGIVCIHLSKDSSSDIGLYLKEIKKKYMIDKEIAVAGGIKLSDIPMLKKEGVDIIIIGGSITQSDNPIQEVKLIKESIYDKRILDDNSK